MVVLASQMLGRARVKMLPGTSAHFDFMVISTVTASQKFVRASQMLPGTSTHFDVYECAGT